ncbi:DUF6571 family protein [Actinomyces wuliandei]|uniref:DUF6571 family protein n=1 Tax=Actinomyces wuliandei TaxID=2057743 RepID=UPI000FDB5A2A|nr:DUF6571 family protein [Actinomyces wuliandei]
MATIFLDPERLQVQIDKLFSVADRCDEARRSIDQRSEELGDPYEGIDFFPLSASNAANNLRACAEDVRGVKDTIVELNENGVAAMDAEGVITCTIPDDVTIESVRQLADWGQGVVDGRELEELVGGGVPGSGRSYEEVLASVRAGVEGDPAYAQALVDQVGGEGLTGLPLEAEDYVTRDSAYGQVEERPGAGVELAGLLGRALAGASRAWGEDRAREVAEEIGDCVDGEGDYGRVTVVNELLGGQEVVFGAEFLSALGARMEQVDQGALDVYAAERGAQTPVGTYARQVVGPCLEGGSLNSLQGVVEAMSHSPQAAAHWLAPQGLGSDADAVARIRGIASRSSIGDNQWTDAVVGMAQAVSALGDIDTAAATSAQVALADQAAVAVSGLLNEIGETDDLALSRSARDSISRVLAVYTPGIYNSIEEYGDLRGSGVDTYTMSSEQFGGSYWGGVPSQALFSNCALSSLVGVVGQDDHGLDPLTERLSLVNDRRFAHATDVYEATGRSGDLEDAVGGLLRAQGFVAASISKEAVRQGEDADARVNSWIDGLMGLTALIPGVEGAGKAVTRIMNYTQANAKDSITTALKEKLVTHAQEAVTEGADLEAEWQDNANRAVILQLIASGTVTSEQLAAWGEAEKAGVLINEDGTLRWELLGSSDEADQERVRNAFEHLADQFPTTADPAVSDAYEDSSDSFDQGASAARGGDDGPSRFGG